MTEKEKQNRDELFRLMRENPDLPVVPMVNGEIARDEDYWYWLGAWGNAKIDEYIIAGTHVYFKSDDDIFAALEDCLTDEEFEALPETEKECRPYYNALPWTKAIIVYIDLPEGTEE